MPLEGNNLFYRSVVSDLHEPVKLLLVYYSRENQEVPKLFAQDKENFSLKSVGKKVQLSIADFDPTVFREQIKDADALYVRGGNTFKLIDTVKQVVDFIDLLEGKVYSGSSAGMYLVCRYFYENDFNKIGEGLGVFQVKGLAHWKDQQDILNKLKAEGEDLPILKLAEGEYKIFET